MFHCRLPHRPNEVDHLRIYIRKWAAATGDESRQSSIIHELYSDDRLCKAFGFVYCIIRYDVVQLLCFYSHFKSRMSAIVIKVNLDRGILGEWLALVNMQALKMSGEKEDYNDCPCWSWFLKQPTIMEWIIPDWEGEFMYQNAAVSLLESALAIDQRDLDKDPLSSSEQRVCALYLLLFRDFNNVPGPLHAAWLEFGFCFYTNRGQAQELARLYLELAVSKLSLGEIAGAYEDHNITNLLSFQGISGAGLSSDGLHFRLPDQEDGGVYRLIAEVNHTLSGRYCRCCLAKKNCHVKFETRLSLESDGDYGFHGTSTWERWQLFNFYKHVFDHPEFNARKMQQARQDPDNKMLDKYLESIVPDFRRSIYTKVLSESMFPKTQARIRFSHGHVSCWCILHDTIAPEGLDCFTGLRSEALASMSRNTGES